MSVATWPKKAWNWLRVANWSKAGAALFAIGILHILTTFASPQLATATAYDRLADVLPLNRMQVLPPITPDMQPLPFMVADARYAMCRFDSTDKPITLTASLPSPGWTLTLYSNDGESIYSAIAQPGRRIEISLQLVPTEERFIGVTPAANNDMPQETSTLTVTAARGIAVLRAPDVGLSYRQRNEAELRRATCNVQTS